MVDSGHITVDVELADAALVGGSQSQKVISLKKTTEYASGKVAVVTGTCGATRLTINPSNLAYRDAAHNQVTFTSIRRIVLQADPGALFYRGFLPCRSAAREGSRAYCRILATHCPRRATQYLPCRALRPASPPRSH